MNNRNGIFNLFLSPQTLITCHFINFSLSLFPRISHQRNHHQRQRAIKGKQKISDVISGELSNEIVKVIKT